MHPHFARLAIIFLVALTASTAFAGPVPANKPAHYPDWWFERDVIPRLPAHATNPTPVWPTHYPVADDYAVANIGQLKHVFAKAAEELNARIPNAGAGFDINDLVTIWTIAAEPGVTRDDFSALNQGQTKALSDLVYKRLRQVGYFGPPLKSGLLYPWQGIEGTSEDNYATLNLGQLKYIFSFFAGPLFLDAYLADSDLDGIPNGWELEHDLDPEDPADAALLNGGLTNLAIYQQFQGGGAAPETANPVGLLVYSP